MKTEMKLDNICNCLPERRKVIEKALSSDKCFGIEDLAIEFLGPEFGWFEIYFKLSGGKPFLIEASDVYPPFPALKKWLEDMLDYVSFSSESLCINCERYNVVLSYDYIGWDDFGPMALIQLGDDISEEDGVGDYEQFVQMVVPIYSFVSKFYYSLKDYINANRRVFCRNWSQYSDCSDFRKFIRLVESKTIEQKLEDAKKRFGK